MMTSRPCPGCGGFGTVIRKPCPECDADGRVRTRRTIKVRIPAGVEDGTHIQLAGEGETGPGGGPPGTVPGDCPAAASDIRAPGRRPHCTVTIPMVAARSARRSRLTPSTADGRTSGGTQSGHAIPMYGQGTERLNTRSRRLIIHVTVETRASPSRSRKS